MDSPPAPSSSRRPTLAAALAGVLAGLLTVAVAHLVAGFRTAASDPVVAVGGAFVDATPSWLKDAAIGLFGTADKVALFVGMAVVGIALFAGLGVLARRSLQAGTAGVAVLAAVALGAVLTREGTAAPDALPTVVGAVCGMLALRVLVTALAPRGDRTEDAAGRPGEHDRRTFLRGAVVTAAIAAVAAAGGQIVGASQRVVDAARRAVRLPVAARPADPLPDDVASTAPGVVPFQTPNDEFYRIDTALVVPQVDPATWTLRVHGMVEEEVEITFDELLGSELVEAWVTLICVSNTVGGDLVGNAKWLGLPVRDVLARARPLPGADMVLSRSIDGFTASTPLEILTDERDALLAVGMNDAPLPVRHGFPVRLVVPGVYGYVSATKWVTELKVTTFAEDVAYWSTRGWSERGPVKTASRIDTPRRDAEVSAGTVPVGGVAWAQQRGITAVEVQVDDGPWEPAVLADEASVDTWRQWTYPWEATTGEHTLRVRATDGDGDVQTSDDAPPAPDGATGWHEVTVTVA
ncbi:molybdopterin-dependent oxidoreductase [Sanguibacter suaedae]|uniref:Molybdopterin-dependent oxidoreductase n=1 Tax=Sanguibacter suaedae TaxID=2795737 RepID=A0A934IAF1_9MICO|nr:molybdopterin-dependent oxidoreductase [Sanguibacter suaedae]MBI9115130.1 molybdopterin-dependent oxidoreductase [Sanguibacter suaedae]